MFWFTLELKLALGIDLWTGVKYPSNQNIFEISNLPGYATSNTASPHMHSAHSRTYAKYKEWSSMGLIFEVFRIIWFTVHTSTSQLKKQSL